VEQAKSASKKRRWVQVASLLALHASWGPEFKWLCLPVLSCHSCALSWFACPIGVLVHFSGYHLFPLFALGAILLLGLLFGRILCGWVCPFGFLQDLMYKIPGRKWTLRAWTGWIKYGVLAVGVIALPFLLGSETWWSFCRICPASALQVSTPGLIAEGPSYLSLATGIKFTFLFAILGFVVVSHRGFCKTACPIGAILGPLNHVAFWAIGMPKKEACSMCGKCDKVCPMDGEPSGRVADDLAPNRAADCIVCHDCQSSCPVHKNEKEKVAAVVSATGRTDEA